VARDSVCTYSSLLVLYGMGTQNPSCRMQNAGYRMAYGIWHLIFVFFLVFSAKEIIYACKHRTGIPLLICGRSTRLCGLPPTRPRQTSDPVFPGKRQPRVSSSLRIFGIRLSARHTCFKRAGFSERSSRCPCKIDDYCPIGLRRFSRKRTALSSEISSSTLTFLASVARTTINQH